MTTTRQYDLVLFGASGFTGGLVAEYLAQVSKKEAFRWALAGRNIDKLNQLKQKLAATGASAPDVLLADIEDADSISAMAAATTAIITTVGPYQHYGEPLVKACAENGTHYVDLTGEPQFVDRMRVYYDEQAKKTGAKIVTSCGFESIPPDIAVLIAVNELRKRLGESQFAQSDVEVRGCVEGKGKISGGTWHSAVEAFSSVNKWSKHRPSFGSSNVHSLPLLPYREKNLALWALPMPSIDPEVVRNSARIRGDYGKTFTYGHYFTSAKVLPLFGLSTVAGGILVLAQFKPTKQWLLNQIKQGDGPSEADRATGWFRLSAVATGGGQTVISCVSGGDPGYGDTAKMLAEAGLALALDKNLPPNAGLVTPASAIGEALVPRLERANIKCEIKN